MRNTADMLIHIQTLVLIFIENLLDSIQAGGISEQLSVVISRSLVSRLNVFIIWMRSVMAVCILIDAGKYLKSSTAEPRFQFMPIQCMITTKNPRITLDDQPSNVSTSFSGMPEIVLMK